MLISLIVQAHAGHLENFPLIVSIAKLYASLVGRNCRAAQFDADLSTNRPGCFLHKEQLYTCTKSLGLDLIVYNKAPFCSSLV